MWKFRGMEFAVRNTLYLIRYFFITYFFCIDPPWLNEFLLLVGGL